MTVVIERSQDEPIIIATFSEPMDYHEDVPNMFARVLEFRDTLMGYSK